MSAGVISAPKSGGDGEEVVPENAASSGMSQRDIARSIYRFDPFIRWPAHWMKISGPRVAVFFFVLGFIDVVALAPLVGHHDVSLKGDWVGLSITFLVRPIMWGVYGWMPFAIAGLFTELQTNGVISGQDERYRALVRESCAQLGSIWITIVAIAFGVGSQVVTAMFISPEGVPPWGEDFDLRFWLFAAPVGAASWYASVKVLVRAALFSIVLSKIFRPSSSISVTIHSVHPDGAGGLGSLGRYAVGMSLFAASGLLFLSMAAIRNTTTDISVDGEVFRSVHLILSLVLLYPVLVWLLLFAPIWLVHRAMLRKLNEDLLEVSNRMDDDLTEMKAISPATDGLAPQLDRLHQLEEAYSLILRTSARWPFSRTTLGYLGAVNLLALTSTALGIALTVKRLF